MLASGGRVDPAVAGMFIDYLSTDYIIEKLVKRQFQLLLVAEYYCFRRAVSKSSGGEYPVYKNSAP